MPYKILPYSYHQAERLGVSIVPSKRKGKKIDVYENGKYICSIGALGMYDFPTYLNDFPKNPEKAYDRRKLYHMRHKKDNVIGTAGWYALRILW